MRTLMGRKSGVSQFVVVLAYSLIRLYFQTVISEEAVGDALRYPTQERRGGKHRSRLISA